MYSLLPLLYFFLLDTLLLLSSCRHEGDRSALPGLRGLLGVRLPVDVPVAPCSASESFIVFVLRFRCIRHFVINVINNICISIYYVLFVICAVIYCSFCCIYVRLDPGTYMIARFMSFCKLGVTRGTQTKPRSLGTIEARLPSCPVGKLLPNQNDLISKPRPSHSSLVVALLSQVVAL